MGAGISASQPARRAATRRRRGGRARRASPRGPARDGLRAPPSRRGKVKGRGASLLRHPRRTSGTPGRLGAPAKPADLKQMPVTALVDVNAGRAWPWHFGGGQQFAPTEAAFVTDDAESECDAVLAGLGFGQLPCFLAIPHIRAGRLVSVLDEAAPDPWDIYVYRPQRAPIRRASARSTTAWSMRCRIRRSFQPKGGPRQASAVFEPRQCSDEAVAGEVHPLLSMGCWRSISITRRASRQHHPERPFHGGSL